MGGAMDLVGSGSQVMVLTEHCSKNGKSKILKNCKLPLTGKNCVKKIITEFAVFEIVNQKMILREIAEDTTLEHVRSITEAEYEIDPEYKRFWIIIY